MLKRLANVTYWAGSILAALCLTFAVAITVYPKVCDQLPKGWSIVNDFSNRPWHVAWPRGALQPGAGTWRVTTPEGDIYWVAGPKDTSEEEARGVLKRALIRRHYLDDLVLAAWLGCGFIAVVAWGFGRICRYVLVGS